MTGGGRFTTEATMPDTTDWLPISQVATYLGVGTEAVRHMIKHGELRSITEAYGKTVRHWVDPASIPDPEERRARIRQRRQRAVRKAHAVRRGEGQKLRRVLAEEWTHFRACGIDKEATIARLAIVYGIHPSYVQQIIADSEGVAA